MLSVIFCDLECMFKMIQSQVKINKQHKATWRPACKAFWTTFKGIRPKPIKFLTPKDARLLSDSSASYVKILKEYTTLMPF